MRPCAATRRSGRGSGSPRSRAQGHDLATFWREVTEALRPAVPWHLTPCFYTLDPASLLVTSHYHEGLPEIPHDWLALEYYAEDFNKLADVARSGRGVATLHEATGGDVRRSARFRETIEPLGGEHEALIALRSRAASAEAWGVLALYREPGQGEFGADELDFLRAISSDIADGVRRGLLIGEAMRCRRARGARAGRARPSLGGRVADARRRALAGRASGWRVDR